jgi:hypothetical protein
MCWPKRRGHNEARLSDPGVRPNSQDETGVRSKTLAGMSGKTPNGAVDVLRDVHR